MNQAIRVTAAALGVSAGIAGLEHGYFEFLQRSVKPDGLFITSIGPPCDPELTWNRCEPALTIVPDFAVTGALAMILGSIIIIWSLFFIKRRYGGQMLILLSLPLLLFGGGLFPPLIGTIAGLAATRINKPLTWTRDHFDDHFSQWLAMLYPWALIAYLVVVSGQWIVGHFYNEWLMEMMWINVLFILGFLILAVVSAVAHDMHKRIEPATPIS
jgi:hypothetical protein